MHQHKQRARPRKRLHRPLRPRRNPPKPRLSRPLLRPTNPEASNPSLLTWTWRKYVIYPRRNWRLSGGYDTRRIRTRFAPVSRLRPTGASPRPQDRIRSLSCHCRGRLESRRRPRTTMGRLRALMQISISYNGPSIPRHRHRRRPGIPMSQL